MDDLTKKKVNGVDAQARKRSEVKTFRLLLVFLVISTLIMFTILVVSYMAFPDINDDPQAHLTGATFHEPYNGAIIKNGGGWTASIVRVTGDRLDLSNMTICIKTPTKMGVTPLKMCLAYNGTEDMSYKRTMNLWYLRVYNTSVTPRFINGTTAVPLNATTAPQLDGPKMPTLEGVAILYRDLDNDGHMSNDDAILVFRDPNGDRKEEFPEGTSLKLRAPDGKLIASAVLG